MSEDEFVVLAEHAGLVDAFDGSADRECVERRQLLRWLEYEGAALFYDRMLAPPSADGNGSDDGEKASIARAVLDRMIEKQWLTPLASDHVHEGLQGDGSEPSQLYLLRMSTTDAYRIYIEKDAVRTTSSSCVLLALADMNMVAEVGVDGLEPQLERSKPFGRDAARAECDRHDTKQFVGHVLSRRPLGP
jgi:hypothetical protein